VPRIISYASGGLANRIRPLLALDAICRVRGWSHAVFWQPDFNCRAGFTDLFSAPYLTEVSEEELLRLEGLPLFGNPESIQNEIQFHPHRFGQVVARNKVLPLAFDEVRAGAFDDAIVFANQPPRDLGGDDLAAYLQGLRALQPQRRPRTEADGHVGLHIRVTDFRVRHRSYERLLSQTLEALSDTIKGQSANRTIRLATDEPVGVEIVRAALRAFQIRPQPSSYPRIGDAGTDWALNTERSFENIRDAVEDLYMLARAEIRIGMVQSTFFRLAQEMAVATAAGADGVDPAIAAEDFPKRIDALATHFALNDFQIRIKDRPALKLARALGRDPLTRYHRANARHGH